ncbi:MAG TPA: hypothetical protein VFP64_19210 [Pyrinomonadaceae bacterium]|nr:hypothetical protein [Pyrinomonadaceae bacterium]
MKKRLNDYLFLEFGFDDEEEDESQISEDWPFALREVGQVPGLTVFEFEDDGDSFFALEGPALDFLPKAGMTFEDLVLQRSGSAWISARDPVDLSMSMPGHESVPSGLERRKALQSIGAQVLAGKEPEILEGLFLRKESRYLGLFRAAGDQTAVIGGLPGPSKLEVLFPDASPWRRLAWGIGAWLRNTTVESAE